MKQSCRTLTLKCTTSERKHHVGSGEDRAQALGAPPGRIADDNYEEVHTSTRTA